MSGKLLHSGSFPSPVLPEAQHSSRRPCGSPMGSESGIIRGMYQTEDMPKGWVKPVAKPTRESLKARIAELRAELAEAESQLHEMEEGAKLEAVVKVRNLMRAFELTPADLGLEPTPTRRGRPHKTATGQEQLRLPAI